MRLVGRVVGEIIRHETRKRRHLIEEGGKPVFIRVENHHVGERPGGERLKNRAGLSWLILVAATLVSWAVGAEHGTGSLVGVVVLGIAAIKVRLVGLDFMELRHAPFALRAAVCVAASVALMGVVAALTVRSSHEHL